MAVIGSFKQQPAETLDYDIDFSEWLPAGDTIVSATVVAAPDTLGLSFAIQSPRIKVWAWNTVDGTTYKITITATTNDGRVKEAELKLRGKES